MPNHAAYADIIISKEPEITVSYRSKLFVCEEGLRDGAWVTLAYNASGYLMATNCRPTPTFMEYQKFAKPMAFAINVDGQDLCSHWQWVDAQVERPGEDTVRGTVRLKHGIRPVEVKIHTLLDGTGIMKRTVEIINTGSQAAALAALSPLSGAVMQVQYDRQRIMPEEGMFRLGYMQSTRWGDEGNFGWVDLPNATYSVASRFQRERYRHPMALIENRFSGEMFILQLAWSGGYAFDFDVAEEYPGASLLSMNIRIDAPAPLRLLAPGDSYESPSVHIGTVFGGLDPAVQAMHEHIRKSVMLPPTRGISGWIESGIGPEFDMDEQTTLKAVEHAASVGAELFFIDAGWYLPPDTEDEWWKRAGDWTYDQQRYPHGIEGIREAVHAKGMLFGMWMDAERIGPDSQIYKDHPEWVATGYDGNPVDSGLLNLADARIAEWMEAQITFLIEEYKIDMFRLDYNTPAKDCVNYNQKDGYLENTFTRYYQNVYGMYARLREKYPEVVFENCAGGGGRTDLGMVAGFTHTWVTDWQLAPNAFRITNGMTMALPPEYVDRLIGGQASYMTGDLDLQLRNMLFARPSISTLKPTDVESNPITLRRVRHFVDLYKNFVRPMHATAKMHHHTPELTGPMAKGYGILEMAQADATRGMVGVFRLADAPCDGLRILFRGVDVSKEYEITFDNSGKKSKVSGYELAHVGLQVQLFGALTSELVLYQAIQG